MPCWKNSWAFCICRRLINVATVTLGCNNVFGHPTRREYGYELRGFPLRLDRPLRLCEPEEEVLRKFSSGLRFFCFPKQTAATLVTRDGCCKVRLFACWDRSLLRSNRDGHNALAIQTGSRRWSRSRWQFGC